jgi:hypothetical protein
LTGLEVRLLSNARPRRYATAVQFSSDGEWFWDDAQWRPAYSPDRRWRWDGRQWVPAGPPSVQRWRYEPTEWTRRLQVIVIALVAFGLVVSIAAFPTVLLPAMQESMDRSIAAQPTSSSVDPAQLRSMMNSIVSVTLGIGAVLVAASLAIIVIGTVRLWRWVYWFLVVGYLIALLSIPQNILYAFGFGTISLPAWWLLASIPFALAEAALGLWMIVLYRRYGTWARRRVPA